MTASDHGEASTALKSETAKLVRVLRLWLLWPVLALVGALLLIPIALGGLYAMSVFFEPVPKETAAPTPGVKVRR